MRALHISIAAGGLYLWSEGTGPDSLKKLKQSCKAIEFKIKMLKGNTRDSFVWLPSQKGSPMPSSPLLGRIPDNNVKIRLQPFHTITRPLEIEEALELCSMARDGNIADLGVIFGDSIYWIDMVLKTALKLMAEAFDNDPFLLFKLRGMEKKAFIKSLRSSEEEEKKVMIEPEPLPADYNKFWEQGRSLNKAISIMPAALHAVMPKRLGPVPFWRSDRDFIEEMEAIYKNASAYAKDLFEKDFNKDKTGP